LIVIFNGPPGSGKDEATGFFMKLGFTHLSFKKVLFRETVDYYGVPYEWFMKDYNDRSVKERKEKALGGLSRREALIYVSEEYIKLLHGKDFFGVQVANSIQNGMDYAISDGGFIEELIPIINKVGADNIVLVQLTREGCDYSSDSRRYFDGEVIEEYVLNHKTLIQKHHVLSHKFPIRTYRIHNNGTLEDFHEVLQTIYRKEKEEYGAREERKVSETNTI
jgi:hypothetical protein